MRPDPGARRVLALVALAVFAALLLWSAVVAALMALADGGLAQALVAVAAQPLPTLLLLALAAFVAAVALAAAWMPWWRGQVAAQTRLLEQAQLLLHADGSASLEGFASPALRDLAVALNQLVQQRREAQADIDQRVQQGSRQLADERARLAALMAELNQAVVVCNLDGRILLYNNRARLQFKALSQAPGVAGGAELIGLGRSVYAVIDRDHLAHALQGIRHRLLRGAASPSTEFVISTRNGQLLLVHLAPVRQTASAQPLASKLEAAAPAVQTQAAQPEPAETGLQLSGFVLMLNNITGEHARNLAQEQLIVELSQGHRASLGKLQAAVELLDDPAMDSSMRGRLQAVVRDETRQMAERLQTQLEHADGGQAHGARTRWPLHEMAGSDLLAAAASRIETSCGVRLLAPEADPAIWLRLDSFALLQALQWLASHVVEGLGARSLRLRLAPHQSAHGGRPGETAEHPAGKLDHSRAQLDLIWAGPGISTETALAWETETMLMPRRAGAKEAAIPLAAGLSVREVLKRHQGSCWFERDRVRHESFFRLLLPRADQQPEAGDASGPSASQETADALMPHDSRPVFYDFDLFSASESHTELDERLLSELNYTVFDTETTGLNPVGGDQIIQLGAVRVVRGRVLRQEHFDQLVDPGRPIPAAGIPIHGITDEMVRGQPAIPDVLPAFHTFVGDTVLVAHNAAFDMKFLQLQEDRTGLRFDQPVLDTLLLSAALHPQQSSHRLEAIAERLGVAVIGRHQALGDALVTADVLVKLLPLLAAKGILTLGQARAAAQQTWYAQLKY